MNIRDRVHSVLQDPLCLSYNELKSIGTYYRPAINNGVGHRFVLECQQSDCSNGWGHAGHSDESNGFGKCVVGGDHFHQLRADEVPLPVEDGNPRTVQVGVKIEKKRLSVESGIVDRY